MRSRRKLKILNFRLVSRFSMHSELENVVTESCLSYLYGWFVTSTVDSNVSKPGHVFCHVQFVHLVRTWFGFDEGSLSLGLIKDHFTSFNQGSLSLVLIMDYVH